MEEASGSSKKYSKLSEQERKHWEDERKKCKAIEKTAGLTPPPSEEAKTNEEHAWCPLKNAKKG